MCRLPILTYCTFVPQDVRSTASAPFRGTFPGNILSHISPFRALPHCKWAIRYDEKNAQRKSCRKRVTPIYYVYLLVPHSDIAIAFSERITVIVIRIIIVIA